MRNTSIVAMCLLLICTRVWAQLPVQTHSFSLDVVVTGSGGGSTTASKSGSEYERPTFGRDYTRMTDVRSKTAARSIELAVAVRNLARTEDRCDVEWYFVGEKVGGKTDYVYDKGNRSIVVKAAGREELAVASKPLERTTTQTLTTYDTGSQERTYRPKAAKVETGARPRGWIVRLVADGKLITSRASSPSLESISRDPQKLAALLAAKP